MATPSEVRVTELTNTVPRSTPCQRALSIAAPHSTSQAQAQAQAQADRRPSLDPIRAYLALPVNPAPRYRAPTGRTRLDRPPAAEPQTMPIPRYQPDERAGRGHREVVAPFFAGVGERLRALPSNAAAALDKSGHAFVLALGAVLLVLVAGRAAMGRLRTEVVGWSGALARATKQALTHLPAPRRPRITLPRCRGLRLPKRKRRVRRGPALSSGQVWEMVQAALHSLSTNRMRSLLTTVGIVIGVSAVIILVSLGNGMQAQFSDQFGKLANQITIKSSAPPSGGLQRQLNDQDVRQLNDTSRSPHISSVTPVMTGNVRVRVGQTSDGADLIGATENYLDLVDRTVVAGSWFTSAQISEKRRTVVLGQQAVNLLWGPGANFNQVVGSRVRLNRTTFTVAGVLDSNGQQDNVVITPFGSSRSYLLGNKMGQVGQIIVQATSADDLAQASAEITKVLDSRHHIRKPDDRDFTISTLTDLLTKSTQFLDFLELFVVAVAGISLLVGGIGVANIMLVSVTERTREIGIRKAIGAPKRSIMRQFLSEAVLLSGLGGLMGITIGVSVVLGVRALLAGVGPNKFPAPILSMQPIVVAFVVSLLIGVLAGGYPAHRAARLRPIQALRFE